MAACNCLAAPVVLWYVTPVDPALFLPESGWPRCGHGADLTSAGCPGIQVGGHTACLAHLTEADRAAHLATLSPGDDIDCRGTSFTVELLDELLDALVDPSTGRPHLGNAIFYRARFTGRVDFRESIFTGVALFFETTFNGHAIFHDVTFASEALFDLANFTGISGFGRATFKGIAQFRMTTIARAVFGGATFAGDAEFHGATFGSAAFPGVTIAGNADFGMAQFEKVAHLGPVVCGKRVSMNDAVFQQSATLKFAAEQVTCVLTRWASTVQFHLRYAELDLRDAVFEYPVVVATHPGRFRGLSGDPMPEAALPDRQPGTRLVSVSGVDAAHLALHEVDLSVCRFAGAVHLDQMKVDGWCTFATTPTSWDRRFPWQWGRRNTLPEEHHWRVHTARFPDRAVARGWTAPAQDAPKLQPAAVAALYRQLRKSLEDSKNEPDAADFYYGECEMRRHDATRPFGERALLTAYWALSGYGLRAARALAWLMTAMIATVLAMVLWGLPVDDPKPQTTGQQVKAGQSLILTTDVPDPRNPTGPWTERVTTERFDKALRVVINSVVFRSSGQGLTTAGTYTEMTSRIAEPMLLGLAVLAIRGRVKR